MRIRFFTEAYISGAPRTLALQLLLEFPDLNCSHLWTWPNCLTMHHGQSWIDSVSWLSLISPFLSDLSFLSILLVDMDTWAVAGCFYPPCATITGLAHSVAAFLSDSDKALTSKLQGLVDTKLILILQGRTVAFMACFPEMLLSVHTQKCASQKACRSSRASAP